MSMALPFHSLSVDELRIALSYFHGNEATLTSEVSNTNSKVVLSDSSKSSKVKSPKANIQASISSSVDKTAKKSDVSKTMSSETIESTILEALTSSEDSIIPDTFPWAESKGIDHLKVIGAIKSLEVDQYVLTNPLSKSFFELTVQGQSVMESKGSQEVLVLKALLAAPGGAGLPMPELQNAVGKDVSKVGMANCMKEKWIKKEGSNLVPVVQLENIEDKAYVLLQTLTAKEGAEDALNAAVRVQDLVLL